jgi:hypothetical protein
MKNKISTRYIMPELLKKLKQGYNYENDQKHESKKLIQMIKGNMKQRSEEDLEILEAGSMKNKMEKFSCKVKTKLRKQKEHD